MSLNQHQQLYEQLQLSQNPLIAIRENPSGDAIVASLALTNLLQKLGQKPEIICPNFFLPEAYKFLPNTELIKTNFENLKKTVVSFKINPNIKPKIEHLHSDDEYHVHISTDGFNLNKQDIKINDSHYKHDLIITLNSPDLESLGKLFENNVDFFYHAPIINIDHSLENEHYGHLNHINITSSSVSEMIYDFIEQVDSKLLDESLATLLLTGMIEKTKSFRLPTVTPKSLNIASHLVSAGAERQSIIENLYQKRTVNSLRLWGRILLNLNLDESQKIASAILNEQDFIETTSNKKELYSAIDELISNIPTVEYTALFYEENNFKYCLIKSEKNADLLMKLSDLKPYGTKSIITIKLNTSPETILQRLKQLL